MRLSIRDVVGSAQGTSHQVKDGLNILIADSTHSLKPSCDTTSGKAQKGLMGLRRNILWAGSPINTHPQDSCVVKALD